MRCALKVCCLLVVMFVVVHSSPKQCVVIDYYEQRRALCGRDDVEHTFDFIPPISQNITFISLRGQPLKQLPYDAFQNVTSHSSLAYLWLQHCRISRVDAGALVNLHNLSFIDLSHNQISHIDSTLFRHTGQIRFINLYFNEIDVVPSGLFQNLTLLEEVHLEYNRIRAVEKCSFQNTPALRRLALHKNQIESMNLSFKDNFDNLTTWWLDGNPWKCNCELGPLYELLAKVQQSDRLKIVCESPEILRGRKWKDISGVELVCPSEGTVSTRGSVMTCTESATDQDDTVPVTV